MPSLPRWSPLSTGTPTTGRKAFRSWTSLSTTQLQTLPRPSPASPRARSTSWATAAAHPIPPRLSRPTATSPTWHSRRTTTSVAGPWDSTPRSLHSMTCGCAVQSTWSWTGLHGRNSRTSPAPTSTPATSRRASSTPMGEPSTPWATRLRRFSPGTDGVSPRTTTSLWPRAS